MNVEIKHTFTYLLFLLLNDVVKMSLFADDVKEVKR